MSDLVPSKGKMLIIDLVTGGKTEIFMFPCIRVLCFGVRTSTVDTDSADEPNEWFHRTLLGKGKNPFQAQHILQKVCVVGDDTLRF